MNKSAHVLLAAIMVAGAAPLLDRPATATPSPPAEMQWREVFSPDGTISRRHLPKESTRAPSARDLGAAAAATVTPIQETGPASQRFDMVIVGDGYTAAQQGLLRQHAEAKWAQIAATAPWNRYRNSVNVWLVNVISNESGVDNDPTPGINRDTALGMYFWCGGTERLLCLNEATAKAYAAQAPGVDAIVAVGNSTKYGGAGYPSLSTVSGGNVHSAEVAIHELGHSVGGLADEYFTPGTTYTGAEPREPNVTRSADGAKWASYLGRPTPDGGVIGAFRGGRYYENGIYRPSQDSLMRSLGKPFNSISLDVMDRAISSKIVSDDALPRCTDPRADALGRNCQRGPLSAMAGGHLYFHIYLPAGVSRLTIGSAGGTGNADLYYNATSWATTNSYTARSTTAGNTETLTISNPAGGYRYISLYATTAFTDVTLSTRY
jgi:hypothetical protein